MVARLLILLALLLGTLPAPSMAAPPCHAEMDVVTLAPASEHGGHALGAATAMGAQPPAPPATPTGSVPEPRMMMGKALCVGCIAPATLKASVLPMPVTVAARPSGATERHGIHGPVAPPETPPPRT